MAAAEAIIRAIKSSFFPELGSPALSCGQVSGAETTWWRVKSMHLLKYSLQLRYSKSLSTG